MTLLDILYGQPVVVPRGIPVHPMGDPEPEFAEAERVDRSIRRWRRRAKRGGGALINGKTRMAIVFAAIAAQPGMTPKAIGVVTWLDPSVVYVALRRLRAEGFIESRKGCHAFPTSKGAPMDRRGDLTGKNIAAWRARKSA
jgi:hypothetical protein